MSMPPVPTFGIIYVGTGTLFFKLVLALIAVHLAKTLKSVAPVCTKEIVERKKMDIVMYGVTGFAGKHAADYLMKQPYRMVWAMAGHNPHTLEQMQTPFMMSNGNSASEQIAAELDDYPRLLEIATRTKVIANFAGPFEKFGTANLIKAAIEGCAHYIDISQETSWMANMLKVFGPAAAARGVAIVQSAGFTSLLPEFLALSAAKDMASDGYGPPDTVWVVYRHLNGIAGGNATIESAKFEYKKYGLLKDPYILCPDVPSTLKVDSTTDGLQEEEYGEQHDKNPVIYAPDSLVDCPVIRRSMHLVFPQARIHVKEYQTKENFESVQKFFSDYQLPPDFEAGDYPPEQILSAGSFLVEGWAFRSNGNKLTKVTAAGRGDPAFKGTSKLSVDLAIGLATTGTLGGIAGYLTPAVALGTQALELRWRKIDNGGFINIKHEIVGG